MKHIIYFIAYIVFGALAFSYIVPHIHGAYFHGNFVTSLKFAALMALVAWLFEVIPAALIGGTLGLAAIPIIIFRLFCFWLIPAMQLKVVAYYSPDHVGFSGWGSAIIAGLAFMVVKWIAKIFAK